MTAERDEIDPLPAIERLVDSHDPDTQWKGLSLLTAVQRAKGQYEALNHRLEAFLASHPDSPQAPMVQHAIARNCLLSNAPERALTEFGQLARRYGAQKREDRSWAAIAVEGMADAHVKAGHTADAIRTLDDFLRAHAGQGGLGDLSFRLAELLAAAGKRDAAIRLLKQIVQAHAREGGQSREHALAEPARLALAVAQSPRTWFTPDLAQLVARLARALRRRDAGQLAALASPFEFSWGRMGTEPVPRRFADLRPIFDAAVRSGAPEVLETSIVQEGGAKAYLLSRNWRSAQLPDVLWFVLTKRSNGWQWSGVAMAEREPPAAPAADPPDGQPLRFTLLAPWKPGKWMLSGDARSYGAIIDSPCATQTGAPGSYYGQGFHAGRDYFAIDFVHWGTCFIVPCPIGGQEVRAVAAGWVVAKSDSNGKVEVRHVGPGGITDGYTSQYLHMNPIFVESGWWVVPGTPLGKVDDRGNSFGAHLHFVLYDVQNGGQSVMPSPIEGIPRGYVGTLECIGSTNARLFDDSDADGVPDAIDNCPTTYNPPAQYGTQGDFNSNGVGDACEDSDQDGHIDASDNCPNIPNPDQANIDRDASGDVCDPDRDGDLVECKGGIGSHDFECGLPPSFPVDNCPDVSNRDQADADGDGLGNACDGDVDGDSVENGADLCPLIADPINADADADHLGDVCDNCPEVSNADQADANNDGEGDECDSDDSDGDGIPDKDDRCPLDPTINCHEPLITPSVLEYLQDAVRAEFLFHVLTEKYGVPVGPGPDCLFCPDGGSAYAEVTFQRLPKELEIHVADGYARELAFETGGEAGKPTYSFPLPHRQRRFLLVRPTSHAELNHRYEIRFEVRYRVRPRR